VTSTTRSRLLAGAIDLGLVLAWALLIAGAAALLITAGPARGMPPLGLHLIGIAVVVLPSTIGLTLLEAGRYEATPGKLKFGLRVRRDPTGERISWGRSLLRNLLKVGLPWTLGHLAAIAVGAAGGTAAVIGVVLALAVPLAYLVSMFIGDGRTIYDHLAGTMVISTEPGRRFA
jgi:uncharacterized RDD family membrane protein YckC